jgi:hypothetical protein
MSRRIVHGRLLASAGVQSRGARRLGGAGYPGRDGRGGLSQSGDAELVVGQCCKRHQSCRAGHVGDDEPVEVVEHGAGDQLAEWAVVTGVGRGHRREVGRPLLLEDDDRRVAQANEDEVECESPSAPVSVEEGADALERIV